jgi:hypothetical protein
MATPKPKRETYAVGGPPITTRSRFMKSTDVFRTGIERQDYGKASKTGELSKAAGDSKSKAPVKPRVKK